MQVQKNAPGGPEKLGSEGGATRDWWNKFEILSKCVLSVAGLMLPLLTVPLVRYHEERSSERQVQLQAEQSRIQRELSQAQLAAGLLPSITKGTAQERAAALEVLSSVAPDLGTRIAQTLQATATTAGEQQLAQRLEKSSRLNRSTQDFTWQTDLAKQYRRAGLQAQAARAYLEAFERAPEELRKQIDAKLVAEARANYDRGNFAIATRQLEEAYQSLVTR